MKIEKEQNYKKLLSKRKKELIEINSEVNEVKNIKMMELNLRTVL